MKTLGILPEIEIFDLSHLHAARRLADLGLIGERPHIQFVMGVQNALPAKSGCSTFSLTRRRRFFLLHMDGCRHRPQSKIVMDWALSRGADAVRTGLEDNIRIPKIDWPRSNAELVGLAAAAVEVQGRRVASAGEARRILGLA